MGKPRLVVVAVQGAPLVGPLLADMNRTRSDRGNTTSFTACEGCEIVLGT